MMMLCCLLVVSLGAWPSSKGSWNSKHVYYMYISPCENHDGLLRCCLVRVYICWSVCMHEFWFSSSPTLISVYFNATDMEAMTLALRFLQNPPTVGTDLFVCCVYIYRLKIPWETIHKKIKNEPITILIITSLKVERIKLKRKLKMRWHFCTYIWPT